MNGICHETTALEYFSPAFNVSANVVLLVLVVPSVQKLRKTKIQTLRLASHRHVMVIVSCFALEETQADLAGQHMRNRFQQYRDKNKQRAGRGIDSIV